MPVPSFCLRVVRDGGGLRPADELAADGGLLLDYGQEICEVLGDGDALECVFEVPACRARAGARGGHRGRVGVGDFRLVRVLGTGASCRVVQVQHRADGRTFAVKMMSKRRLVAGERKLERAVQEKRLLARLSHPFVVSMHWALQTRSHLFMVMDYCPGGELFHHLQKRGRFSEPDCRFYVCEILLGLEYLHSLGILSKDLKPENCLLDGGGHLRLTDFGLSKENLTTSALFQSFVGTVLYLLLSPEMIRREGHGRALDFYCLGCLLYVLLTGSLPHFTGDVRQMCARRARGEAFEVPRRASEAAADLLEQLLEDDPARRLGSQRQAMEIKEHAWFQDVDFYKVYRKEPQLVFPNFPPVDVAAVPYQCFSSEFTQVPVPSQLLGWGSAASLGREDHVAGFSRLDDGF
ncbi:unnamed protein product [Prorocentrum cordatum]|uniref:Protein kinase domain-containing protein n=1 Tax=Prorocentrum cordatum TaxID=2364126 RepID=A0ABN9UY31_9DINO|nr:unnamed protein product [Polarella glacialis]